MKQKIALGIGLVFLFLLFPVRVYGEVYLTEEEALKTAFPEADRIEKKTAVINKAQREQIEKMSGINRPSSLFTYYEGIKGNETTGYAVIKKIRAKLSYITFIVITDNKGITERVTMMEYNGLYGSGIKNETFLRQFRSKSVNAPLSLNSDIDAVTGATISSRVLTNAVKEILAYLYIITQEQINEK